MPTQRDFYEVLGVSKPATKQQIKSAYRKMELQYHPDRNKATDSEAKFKEVNEAYQVLSDDKKRQAYDQFGHSAFDPSSGFGGNPYAGGQRQGPFTYTYSTSGGNPFGGFDVGGFNDPFEIFESFFGGNPFGGRQPRKPHYSLSVSFMDAVKGSEKTVEIDGKKRTIKIPPGADDGTRIQYDDFTLTLSVQDHLEVPFTVAILGGTESVETIDGPLKLKINEGTQPNTLVRLRDRGVQSLRGRGRGDQYVRIIVTIPKKLSKSQKKLIEEFENS
jgi:DnaJ-class molecular chaperone